MRDQAETLRLKMLKSQGNYQDRLRLLVEKVVLGNPISQRISPMHYLHKVRQ